MAFVEVLVRASLLGPLALEEFRNQLRKSETEKV
jgi:hypothetical protein